MACAALARRASPRSDQASATNSDGYTAASKRGTKAILWGAICSKRPNTHSAFGAHNPEATNRRLRGSRVSGARDVAFRPHSSVIRNLKIKARTALSCFCLVPYGALSLFRFELSDLRFLVGLVRGAKLGGNTLTEREFGNFSEWPLKELLAKERTFTVGDMRGAELQAEITRRRSKRDRQYVLAGVIAAAISAFGSMIAAIASLLALHAR